MVEKTTRGGRRGLIAIALLGVAVVGSAGVGVGALVFAPATPESLATAAPISEAPVTSREFADPRTVEVGLTLRADTLLASPASGRVTALTCQSGAVLESGRTDLAVDGRGIVNLATTVPLWRDLVRGDRGDDVKALQSELARLGHPVSADGVVRGSTITAFRALLAGPDAKPDPTITTVELARILWLPAAAVEVSECAIATGADVAAGDKVASVPNGLADAAITHLPTGLAAGDRVLTIDGVSAPVEADGRVVAPEALTAIAGSQMFAATIKAGTSSLTASLALAAPVEVSVVPPGALYNLDGDLGCVSSGGSARAVKVLGSELGQTFVTFDDGAALASVDLTPSGAKPCR